MFNAVDTTDTLVSWCEERGTETGINEFLQVLHEQNSQYLIPHILQELQYRQVDKRKSSELHVKAARPLTDSQLDDLRSAFDVVKSTASPVTTEQSLFGGASCSQNGWQVADTFRSRLQKLQARLQL